MTKNELHQFIKSKNCHTRHTLDFDVEICEKNVQTFTTIYIAIADEKQQRTHWLGVCYRAIPAIALNT